jgi:hypothetical protein
LQPNSEVLLQTAQVYDMSFGYKGVPLDAGGVSMKLFSLLSLTGL